MDFSHRVHGKYCCSSKVNKIWVKLFKTGPQDIQIYTYTIDVHISWQYSVYGRILCYCGGNEEFSLPVGEMGTLKQLLILKTTWLWSQFFIAYMSSWQFAEKCGQLQVLKRSLSQRQSSYNNDQQCKFKEWVYAPEVSLPLSQWLASMWSYSGGGDAEPNEILILFGDVLCRTLPLCVVCVLRLMLIHLWFCCRCLPRKLGIKAANRTAPGLKILRNYHKGEYFCYYIKQLLYPQFRQWKTWSHVGFDKACVNSTFKIIIMVHNGFTQL